MPEPISRLDTVSSLHSPKNFAKRLSMLPSMKLPKAKSIEIKSSQNRKLVSTNSKGVLQRIFEVLYLAVFDNEYACNEIEQMLVELIELLPLSEATDCSIPSLLVEIFRVIDPDIPEYKEFFENWVDRFAVISFENIK